VLLVPYWLLKLTYFSNRTLSGVPTTPGIDGVASPPLAPPDAEEWSRLADMSLEQGDTPQACICYRKAIDAEPTNARQVPPFRSVSYLYPISETLFEVWERRYQFLRWYLGKRGTCFNIRGQKYEI